MSIAKDIENLDWKLDCPACKAPFDIKLKQAKGEEIITCQNCGTKIQLKDDGKSTIKSMKLFEELDKTIDDFGK
ncbi:MAG: hypothetical protein KAS32_10235 [Candidatus Peribacteraceae bacterium]|nr:hypothetical protein [Candidatus Peribacteraceae bacterium]